MNKNIDNEIYDPDGKPVKPRNWIESLNCAIEGIIYTARTQKHMRYHFIIAVLLMLVSLVLHLPLLEFMIFAIAIIMLLTAEMINTAIEETVNLVEEKYNIKAKLAKDAAAGAVLISAIALLIVAYYIFSRYFYRGAEVVLRESQDFYGHMAVVALLLCLVGVVFIKAFSGKGRPLEGGLPSGHAAISFSMWVSVTVITLNPFVSILVFVMAVMISQSRIVRHVHSVGEVVLGALFGGGVTLVIFFIFSTLLK
jgi:diacylglycerol kinase (ATP)